MEDIWLDPRCTYCIHFDPDLGCKKYNKWAWEDNSAAECEGYQPREEE